MNQTVEAAGRELHPWLAPTEPIKAGPTPPPGWRSDEANWVGIQNFLGQMGKAKKAVSRG